MITVQNSSLFCGFNSSYCLTAFLIFMIVLDLCQYRQLELLIAYCLLHARTACMRAMGSVFESEVRMEDFGLWLTLLMAIFTIKRQSSDDKPFATNIVPQNFYLRSYHILINSKIIRCQYKSSSDFTIFVKLLSYLTMATKVPTTDPILSTSSIILLPYQWALIVLLLFYFVLESIT